MNAAEVGAFKVNHPLSNQMNKQHEKGLASKESTK
jgi:hypothetical protein